MGNEGIRIHLMMDGREFIMTVRSEREEELYRKAASQINNMLNKYRSHFPKEDTERLLTMVAFELAYARLNTEDKNDAKPFKDKLKALTRELDKCISE